MGRTIFSLALTLMLSISAAQAKDAECCSEHGGCKAKVKGDKKPLAGSMYQIKVTQSGGIAGINKSMTIDSSTLKKPQQNKLADLIADTGILKVDNKRETTAGAADMFFYEFEVTCCGNTHKATFDEGTLPASYRALREYLNSVQKK